jgi:NAD(P)-dependent dehydrogenase (short-subunit alcohol dehydrogenase family)
MAKQSLDQSVVVVTGSARGMGAAFGEALLADGGKVVFMDQTWDGSEEFKAKIDANPKALSLTCDIASNDDIAAAFKATIDAFGTVDVLINNAGRRQRHLYPPHGQQVTLEVTDEEWLEMYNVNVFGQVKMTRAFIKPMIEKQRGAIMSISSGGSVTTALRPSSREQPYMSAKAAFVNLTIYLSDEVKQHNIAVNVVIPGHTRTTGFDEQTQARLAQGRTAPRAFRADAAAPLISNLAELDVASGPTGKIINAIVWNEEHGLGSAEAFIDPASTFEGQ